MVDAWTVHLYSRSKCLWGPAPMGSGSLDIVMELFCIQNRRRISCLLTSRRRFVFASGKMIVTEIGGHGGSRNRKRGWAQC